MRQTTKRFSSMIIALVLLVGALIIFFDLVQPAYTKLQESKGKQLSQADLITNEKKIVSDVQGLVSSFKGEAQGVASVGAALPVGPHVADAITQVTGLAAADGVAIQTIGITLQNLQTQGAVRGSAPAAGGQIASAATTGSLTKPLGVVSLTLTAEGSYESFKTFIQGLESNIRIFDVKGITVHPLTSAATGKGSADSFNYTVTVSAYYQTQ